MITAVTGNQRNDMIVGTDFDARIIEGLGLCAAQEIQESLIAAERRGSGVPFTVLHIDHGEHGILAQVIQAVQVNCLVALPKTLLFI